jgi:AP endonuclease-1
VPHGSYLVNLAQSTPDKAKQAYDCFLEDLQRCESLGIGLYNFHPGARLDSTREGAIARIASQLNSAHAATKSVITLLENMAGGGTVIGSTFEDLADIIALIDDKSRIGVCIDTCHTFAAGYDLRSPEAFAATMKKFDDVVGLKYLKALHVNDSKAPLGSRRDLHANIGTGFLGLRAFHNVVNFAGFEGLPMVLETPIDQKIDGKTVEDKSIWAREIKLLEGLIGRDVESEGFKEDEKRLWESGKAERDKVNAQVEKKAGKGNKKISDIFKPAPKTKPKAKAKGKKKDEESASEVDEE